MGNSNLLMISGAYREIERIVRTVDNVSIASEASAFKKAILQIKEIIHEVDDAEGK